METTQPQPKKLPKLTKKRKGFVEDYVATGNATEAVVRNFDVKDREVAKSVGSELLTFPNVAQAIEIKQETLRSALINKGITPEKIADKINVLLDKDDPNSIDKGLKHATAIYGITDPEKPKDTNVYNFFFEPTFQQNIKNYDENFKNQILKAQNVEETETN